MNVREAERAARGAYDSIKEKPDYYAVRICTYVALELFGRYPDMVRVVEWYVQGLAWGRMPVYAQDLPNEKRFSGPDFQRCCDYLAGKLR